MNSRHNLILAVIVSLLVGFQIGYISNVQIGEQVIPLGEEPTDSSGGLEDEAREINLSINDTRSKVYNAIFARAKDSVVSIQTLKESDSGFTPLSSGSGFFYDKKGRIITNHHVIEKGDAYEVTTLGGNTYEANIVGKDPYTDLAVLDIDKKTGPLPIGESERLKIGEAVLAIGNPFGLSGSMTSGIVSQKGRLLPAAGNFSIPGVIQTDAAINPGNSGGPLLNLEGKVIGINTAINTRTTTFSGVGFAVPSITIKNVVPELIEEGEYAHSWIGVEGTDVTPAIAEEIGMEKARGFLVIGVQENSPADRAGIQGGERTETVRGSEIELGGDVIVGIEGQKVRKINDILNYLSQHTSVGEEITLTVLRDGEEKEIKLTLAERPSAQ
ncbi:MAG: trypsin-like peptidase domain-containing protein [Candidatus Nanohaloarchaeota archaeon QJJ-9]|nr:trypsin-like peptidase domain-containing protein [Candidatus Nanohaloarchaeota archaeon QJJ-9]